MKTILITGSNSTVGIAVAKALAEQPVQLALQYYSNEAKALALKSDLDAKAVDSCLFQTDLTNPDQAKHLVNMALKKFGKLDALINVVGPYVYKNILEVTPQQWLDDINLNLHSACPRIK